MPDWACVNGEYVALDEAKVSINDRGLLFGDSVYEVLHAHGGRLWLKQEHLARLANSLAAISLAADVLQVERWMEETLRQSGWSEALVYVQVTRGTAARSHIAPPDIRPTVIVTARGLRGLDDEIRQRGVSVITLPEPRWARRDIKSTNLLPNLLAKQQAEANGAFEALFVEADGTVNEGSSSNVFMVQKQTVVTPLLGPHLLPGVTRACVAELASQAELPVIERAVLREELDAADEVFLTGTTTEVLGVVQIDGSTIGDGTVGPVTGRLYDLYRRAAHGDST